MNILLFGSTGFVGRHLNARLVRDGHLVTRAGRNYHFPSGDFDYDAVINCAGEITDVTKMYGANVALVERILSHAKNLGIKKVIQIGSSSEYGDTNAPRFEGASCTPVDIYSATKLAATMLCQGYAEQYDMDVVVARPFSLYGPRDTPRKLIPRLIESRKGSLAVDLHPGSHDWVHIDDFVEGLIVLLNAPKEKTQGDIVNFGSGVATTNLEVARLIPGTQFTYKPEQHVGYINSDNWVADTTKARERFGWVTKTRLEDGLRRTWVLS